MNNHLNININKDEVSVNDYLVAWSIFGSRPNKVLVYDIYLGCEFVEFINKITSEETILSEMIPSGDKYFVNEKVFAKINENVYISYIIVDKFSDECTANEVTFYVNKAGVDYTNDIISQLKPISIDDSETEDKLKNSKTNTISIGQNGIEIENLNIEDINYDSVEFYYSKEVFKKLNKLIKGINKSKKGLSILYGDRGLGKTSVVNYISNKLKDKYIIFIPNNMIESTINNPDFRKFLINHDKCILVIDDCEMLFNEAYTRSNIFANNLLQLVDGYLSDLINVNIIALFNLTDEEEIDHSLLNCNNKIDIIEFEKLSIEESNRLSNHLGNSKKYTNSTSLIDVIKNRNTKDENDVGL